MLVSHLFLSLPSLVFIPFRLSVNPSFPNSQPPIVLPFFSSFLFRPSLSISLFYKHSIAIQCPFPIHFIWWTILTALGITLTSFLSLNSTFEGRCIQRYLISSFQSESICYALKSIRLITQFPCIFYFLSVSDIHRFSIIEFIIIQNYYFWMRYFFYEQE